MKDDQDVSTEGACVQAWRCESLLAWPVCVVCMFVFVCVEKEGGERQRESGERESLTKTRLEKCAKVVWMKKRLQI